MLLQKAKVITTPTAYSDGFLHSVKPNVVLGDELVVNGDFSNGTSDWSPNAAATLSIDNGRLKVSISGAASGYPLQNITTEVGKTYKVTANGFIGTSSRLALYNNADNVFNSLYADGSLDFTFVATSTSTQLRLYVFDDGAYGFWDNISVKEKIDADFTFTRNSSATRVGEDGYIQDVQIIGGELVQNGDFEQIGSELVTNGNFSNGDTGWNLSANTSVANNKLIIDALDESYQYARQNLTTIVGNIYKFQFDITEINNVGEFQVLFDNVIIGLPEYTSVGTYTVYFKSNNPLGAIELKRKFESSTKVTIDNVSVKEVGQNWNFAGDWTMGDGVATITRTAVGYDVLSPSSSVQIGKNYRFECDVVSKTGGTLLLHNDWTGNNYLYISSNTSERKIWYFTATSTIVSVQFNGAGETCVVDNVSIVEITDDTNLPRINYEGFSYENGLPIYGSGKGHFLLEGQSTNLIPYSDNTSTYTKIYGTLTNNQILSPENALNGFKFLETTNIGAHGFYYGLILSASTNYSVSIFVKKLNRRYIGLQYWYNPSNGAIIYIDLDNAKITGTYSVGTGFSVSNEKIEDYGNGWYRVSGVFQSDKLDHYYGLVSMNELWTSGTSYDHNFAGDDTKGFYAFGFQVEQNSHATSYIPTNGSAVTRAAETCNNAGNADLFDSEGVLYAEIAALADDLSQRQISIDAGGDITNRIVIRYNNISNNINAYAFSGSVQGGEFNFVADDITEFNKVAIRYKDNDFSFWANGVQVGTDTSGTAPTGLASLQFRFSTANDFRGKTKMVGVFPYLSNDEMECLTGEGYGSFGAMALANNYTIIQG